MVTNDIEKQLSAAFERDPWVEMHQSPISIAVDSSSVTLEGEVEHVAAKRRAVALARQMLGNRYTVVDRLRRRPTESLGDDELATTLLERFSRERVFLEHTLVLEREGRSEVVVDAGPEAYGLSVAVDEGAVTLSGTVGSLMHKRLAEVLAWWIPGCRALRNELVVTPPQDDSDDELNDAVRFALELDPIVDATQLRVSTESRIVSLAGFMDEAQHRSAVHDAWLVPGVYDVSDRIEQAP